MKFKTYTDSKLVPRSHTKLSLTTFFREKADDFSSKIRLGAKNKTFSVSN